MVVAAAALVVVVAAAALVVVITTTLVAMKMDLQITLSKEVENSLKESGINIDLG